MKDLAKRMRNEHFIYDVVTLIQEELRNHNQPSTSGEFARREARSPRSE